MVEWPVRGAVLGGEACTGMVTKAFEERNRTGGDMSVLAFDLLELDGQPIMQEPWKDRRKRRGDVFASLARPRVRLVPLTEDAATLYETWVGWGARASC